MGKKFRKQNPAVAELERLYKLHEDENGEADLTVCGPVYEGLTDWFDLNPPSSPSGQLAEKLIESWKKDKKLTGRNGQPPLFEWTSILTLGDGKVCEAGEATYDQCQRHTLVLTREHNDSISAYLTNMEWWTERMGKFGPDDTLGAVEIREFDYVRDDDD